MPASLISTPTAREAPPDIISSNTPSSTAIATPATTTPTPQTRQKLSDILPPLVFGTATLNYQFNVDPYALHPNTLVSGALASGVRAFDTSPYYGPAEEILGTALHSSEVTTHPTLSTLRRQDYYILTKAGRISSDQFDYSPSWIRHSVKRSLRRLRTTYLDVVYLHDVEFVSPEEVLSAIKTLREIRDETGTVHHVGICGYPVHTLTSLAEMILRETDEPLDIVQSYANFTIQNQRLKTVALQRLIEAGVDVVANASPLGMGLLRSQGVPIGSMGNWHPAPDDLRAACLKAATYVQEHHDEKLETVAVRFAMKNWLTVGADVGSKGSLPSEVVSSVSNIQDNITTTATTTTSNTETNINTPSRSRIGVNVMGVSKLSELEDTMKVYNSITSSSSSSADTNTNSSKTVSTDLDLASLANTIRETILGSWTDHAWDSPDPGFVNQRKQFGVSEAEMEEFDRVDETKVDEGKAEDGTLAKEVTKHLERLEKSVSLTGTGSDRNGNGNEKAGEVEVGVAETARELTPPS